jgi:alkylation response protein AidB-like acyl-CoA dehydrogenase
MEKMSDGAGVINELKRLGLFGMSISKAYGGLEMNSMEVSRLLEALGKRPGLFCRFLAHCGWVAHVSDLEEDNHAASGHFLGISLIFFIIQT